MEEFLEQIAGKIVRIILPTTSEGFSFDLRGYLLPRYGHPAGFKVNFEGGFSSLWFLPDSVHAISVETRTIVLKSLKEAE